MCRYGTETGAGCLAGIYGRGMDLSDDEFDTIIALLRRFMVNDMDQWANWMIGPSLFVSLSRAPFPGATSEAYLDLSAR